MSLDMLFAGMPAIPALHIPDGFMSTSVSIMGWILALVFVGIALYQTRGQLGEKQIPMMGVLAAFIFAAQSINFPVGGGTSGHLIGGTLAAIVLGPWAAILVMTSVVTIQALVFQDGGVLALGCNIVNMAILTSFTGHAIYQLVRRVLGPGRKSTLVGGAVGGWLSMIVGAVGVGVQLAISGTSPLGIAVPAMGIVHALLGVLEAIITVGALSLITSTRPDLLNMGTQAPAKAGASWAVMGLVGALIIAAFSPLASPNPDGLETVAAQQGFIGRSLNPIFNIFPDYTIPFINNPVISGIIAVMIGTLMVFGIAYLIARVAVRRMAQ